MGNKEELNLEEMYDSEEDIEDTEENSDESYDEELDTDPVVCEDGEDEEEVEEVESKYRALRKHPDLAGLDIKEGRFRIKGSLSASPVYRRKGPNTNLTKSCGYAVEEIATGRVMYVTKMEGIALAAKYGMQNAYIIKHERDKKDNKGEVIKTSETIYLQPYPAREESFTQDGRLINVFQLDQNNKLQYPLEILIEEEQCTKDFWLLVQKIYKQKKHRRKRSKKRERNLAEKRRKRILEIEAEISKVSIENPFE